MSGEPGVVGALDLVTPTALGLAPGQTVTIRGEVQTRHDGATFDGAALFATEGTGLRVVTREQGLVQLVATNDDAPACRAVGLSAPCLVPRTATLAHERLLSIEEFTATLSGQVLVDVPPPPAPPLVSPGALASVAVLVTALATTAIVRARRARPIARVERAARDARRGVRGLPTEAALLAQIDALVSHARALDRLKVERDRALRGIADIEVALGGLARAGVDEEGVLGETQRALAQLNDELAIGEQAAAEAAMVAGR